MRTFSYRRANALEDALAALREPGTQLLAGGTELVNWLKEGIESPSGLVDITGLDLAGIEHGPDGLTLGALVRMSDAAADPHLQRDYPVFTQSLLKAASPQLRNMATLGGNLMQRTRCPYFRADTALPCNKRAPGSGCSARHGENGSHAIFGWSDECVATHPSDLAVALSALDAEVLVRGENGERRIPAAEFHRLPGEEPARHNELAPDELITAIRLPATARASHYLKVRERVSYEFAVVSAAAVVEVEGGVLTSAKVALGGVAHRPWRLYEAEAALPGIALDDVKGLRAAVAESFTEAKPLSGNEYKVVLAQRAAVRALRDAGATA
ncbi:FAD binding domain-containing protein [Amycolatopsis nigrescens]|uniref:FAD binding domain-containing protein n=1 Tax=Amycolatopsis nigrescens TaxID=381445 RepID=UPI0003748206|nr:xanthine dehydrogenase family protein subunit M [Amycolatopsis nigrescens]